MGGTLASQLSCGCEFWEILDHAGELVPDFIACKKHGTIREQNLQAENEKLKTHRKIQDELIEANYAYIDSLHDARIGLENLKIG